MDDYSDYDSPWYSIAKNMEDDVGVEIVDGLSEDFLLAPSRTGADIYAMHLAMSLGGKALHGFNSVPSCEYLVKVDEEWASKRVHGRLSYVESPMECETSCGVPEFEKDMGPNFTAVRTATGMSLLYEDEEWEPSSHSRAKAIALLVASMVNDGMQPDEANSVGVKIAGEALPVDIHEGVIAAQSSAKRNIASFHKPVQTVWGVGNYQKRIRWKDQNMVNENANSGVDWGRTTCIARYIAECNMQLDPNFALYAARYGVPFSLVIGTATYSTPIDSLYDPALFTGIELPADLDVFQTPLCDIYGDHADSMVARARKILDNSISKPTTYNELMELVDGWKARSKRFKTKVHVRAITGTDIIAPVTKHNMNSDQAAEAVRATTNAATHHAKAITTLLSTEPALKEACRKCVAFGSDSEATLLGRCGRAIFAANTIEMSLRSLAAALGSEPAATKMMNRHIRKITKTSGSMGRTPYISDEMAENIKLAIILQLKKALLPAAPRLKPLHMSYSVRGLDTLGSISKFLKDCKEHVTVYANQWANRYQEWSRIYAQTVGKKRESICYGTTAGAFRRVKAKDLVLVDAGFSCPNQPTKTYLWSSVINYTRKRKIPLPELPAVGFPNMEVFAVYLDATLNAEVPFLEVVKFVQARMLMLSDDIWAKVDLSNEDTPLADGAPREEDDQGGPSTIIIPQPKCQAVDQAMLDEIAALMAGSYAEIIITKEAVLATYPSEAEATRCAAFHEYKDFASMYEELGERARWDTESTITQAYLYRARSDDEAVEDDTMEGVIS